MSDELIFVAMPVRNCRATIRAAVRSILNQTFESWTLLLLDDGSTDGTLEQLVGLEDSRIRMYSDGESVGLARRLNQAIDLANAPYVARMDGDDIAYPERLEQQVRVLEEDRDIDLVGAPMLVFANAGAVLGFRPVPATHDAICSHPWAGFPLAHPTWCGRREWFTAHPYDPAAILCEDQDLLLRSWRHSRFANLGPILHGYREPGFDVHKALTARRHFVASSARQAGGWLRSNAIRTLFAQAARGVADGIAHLSGAEKILLPHRHRPIAAEEVVRWQRIAHAAGEV
jgi:glycosyltransferase involved in cell wall biosynthesis